MAESPEYHAARDRQSFIESRLRELEDKVIIRTCREDTVPHFRRRQSGHCRVASGGFYLIVAPSHGCVCVEVVQEQVGIGDVVHHRSDDFRKRASDKDPVQETGYSSLKG